MDGSNPIERPERVENLLDVAKRFACYSEENWSMKDIKGTLFLKAPESSYKNYSTEKSIFISCF